MRYNLPLAMAGQTVGLLGGSFDPPHSGHVALSTHALARLSLTQVWWVVSPQNPLKRKPHCCFEQRVMAAQDCTRAHPRINVTALELSLPSYASYNTMRKVHSLWPHTRFVWLIGADVWAEFHLWQNWRAMMQFVPIAVFARPHACLSALHAPAARVFARARVPAMGAHRLGYIKPPAWIFVSIPMCALSSRMLRRKTDI